MDNFLEEIATLRNQLKSKPLAYYGVGGMGKSFLNFSRKLGFEPDMFLDSDESKIGSDFSGIPVQSIDHAKAIGANIVITNSYHFEIRPLFEGYSGGSILHSKAAATLMSNDTFQTYSSLSDTISKETYSSLLKYFLGESEEPIKSDYLQYILPTLNFKNINSLVDAGAFDGGSYSKFRKLCGDNIDIHSFEPIPENFEKLQEKLLPKDKENIRNIGLWSEKTKLAFDLNMAASRILPKGSTGVLLSVSPLDEFELSVDYIKMDIEGAEKNALLGAVETIKRCQPNLAISIYHGFQDFIELPILIQELLPNHSYFLGHHFSQNQGEAFLEYETVFYAIRKADLK